MQYLGGKAKIAKELARVIASREINRAVLVEPFCGGGNATAQLAPYFGLVTASDAHPDLIAMWQALASGWEPPDAISQDEFFQLKNGPTSPLRGFAGFACSYAGQFFSGYATNARGDDFCGAGKRAVLRDIQAMRNVVFGHWSYEQAPVAPGCVVYCDPPYAGTAGYSTGVWRPDLFWDVARHWRRMGARVYVSEYTAPSDWTPVWTRERRQGINQAVRTELLVC